MEIHAQAEQHIEVHKFYGGAIAAVVVLALFVQATLPRYVPRASMLELPLLVTLYFALSRRNPTTGLLLGMVIGILQDALGRTPIGLYGITKTLVGYVGSSIGARIDVEHPVSRFLLAFGFFHFQQAVITLTKRWLLGEPEAFVSVPLLIASLVNAALAIGLFPALDKLRRPS